jgi:ribonuclease P protein component
LKKNKLLSLKSKEAFKSLFKNGEFHKEKNVGVRYCEKEKGFFYVGYAVSKKHFSKAVDRNLIKRRIKSEVYKTSDFFIDNCPPGIYLFFYMGKRIPLSVSLSSEILGVLKKLVKKHGAVRNSVF